MLTKVELYVLMRVWVCFERHGNTELCVFDLVLLFFQAQGQTRTCDFNLHELLLSGLSYLSAG